MGKESIVAEVEVCEHWDGHIHPYPVKHFSRHPIHMIEGGSYLTEDTREFNPAGDMGYFGLNAKDYAWYKNHTVVRQIKIER